ncbi:hypothetical protein [Schaalia sp. lx-260]|uniref:hypothetical protein n=1 Tax=Schaalia sp. lx-260 TaxID=2899082 RepID=UPI001E5E75BA|nr:hypothetical protein [Schaalia sp. lx-260]MCD4550091.1 hypothetical protein [Schaalia sp. lx-260]
MGIASATEDNFSTADYSQLTTENVAAHPEVIPYSAIVAAVVAAVAGSYKAGYDDGVARAATGQITWSQWNGKLGWAITAAVIATYPIGGIYGVSGYQGWKSGFSTECAKHSYCINK